MARSAGEVAVSLQVLHIYRERRNWPLRAAATGTIASSGTEFVATDHGTRKAPDESVGNATEQMACSITFWDREQRCIHARFLQWLCSWIVAMHVRVRPDQRYIPISMRAHAEADRSAKRPPLAAKRTRAGGNHACLQYWTTTRADDCLRCLHWAG
jgi:hypothetical protein